MMMKRKRQSPPSPSPSSPSSSSCHDDEESHGHGGGRPAHPKRPATTRVTILHVCPPVVVRVDPHDFRLTVQKLTGLGSSSEANPPPPPPPPPPPCAHPTPKTSSYQHHHMDLISLPSLGSSTTTSSYSSSSPPHNSHSLGLTPDDSEFNSKSHLHDSLSVDYYDWSADIPESPPSHHHPEPRGYADLSLSGIQSFSKFNMPPPPPSSFVDCYRPTLEHLQYSELTTRGSMQPFPDLDMSILDCYCPSLDHLQVELAAS